jgi:hypothetical protein
MVEKATEIQHPLLKDTSDNLLTYTHDKIRLLMRTHVMRENVQDLEPSQFPNTEDP